ncbi:glutathione S-transferase family protein [Ensifer sp. LCM 4579]|uniref:glutathione S-transferase family protein n=1 Tax=Ensifer sp. LCM 4579 TaxID=1848292 RepID=UPI0008D9ECCC|nr:glutathione S-transferase [Ensifer sp. LCM 4579]OHV78090.1 glutathione S-transferase [Ensifer sp. LCM 4579]
MLTLIHAPLSRSSRIIWLLEEIGAEYEIRYVDIRRWDGSGGPDENNPHPHKQVPALLHNETLIWESVAVVQYLTDLHPDCSLGRPAGHPDRGAYLSWLAYYAGVIEPAASAQVSGLTANNPALARLHAEMCAHVIDVLTRQPYLIGDRMSAADLLLASALQWMRKILPESDVIDRYVRVVTDRPALLRAREIDSKPSGFHD